MKTLTKLILIATVFYSCEQVETHQIIHEPEQAHKFIMQQTEHETIQFSINLDELSELTNILNLYLCTNQWITESEKQKHQKLKQQTIQSLNPLLDKLESLTNFVNNDILNEYIKHYSNYEKYIIENIIIRY